MNFGRRIDCLFRRCVAAFILAAGLTCLPVSSRAEEPARPRPAKGQIVVDPENPGRMVFHDTYTADGFLKPAIFAGPGDPEHFFYGGRQEEIIARLTQLEARCVYITAVLKDFGGGDPGRGEQLRRTLGQWEKWISKLEEAGIVTVFFFFDDDGAWRDDWQDFARQIVEKFKHHRLLVWCVAEEYSERRTRRQISEFAKHLKVIDDRKHVVAVHQLSGTAFDFADDPSVDMFAMQHNVGTVEGVYDGVLSAWRSVGGQKIVNMSELAGHGDRDDAEIRRINWASVMAGADAVQVLSMGMFYGDKAGRNTPGSYRDAAILTDFLRTTDINRMSPSPELAAAGTKWLLAQPGRSYLAYADQRKGSLGVKNMAAGDYRLTWLDIPSGRTVVQKAAVKAGNNEFLPPEGVGEEVALWIYGAGERFNPVLASVDVFPPQKVVVKRGNCALQAVAKDQYGRKIADQLVWSVDGGGTIANGRFQSDGTLGDFTVTATSGTNSKIKATALVRVIEEYGPPVAQDKRVATRPNRPVSVSLPVWTDSPGPLTFTILEMPQHGRLSLAGNDADYLPEKDFSGKDAFRWLVRDEASGKSAQASVEIQVGAKGK